MSEKKSSWMDVMQNPRGLALKKYIAQLLENKYPAYDETINRAISPLVTENDMMSFGKMLADIYEAGYIKAVNDYKSQLEQLNIKVNITTQKSLGGNQ